MAGLLLLAGLTPSRVRAQTNTAKAAPSSQRWLLIVETSRAMQRRANAVVEAVQDLLTSGMAGQLRPGDTLGVWTFNDDLAGRAPVQKWSPEAQQDIAARTLAFLQAQKYEKQAHFDKVLPALGRVISDSQFLTVILVSSGDEKIHGTPFDAQINEFCQKWHGQQQKARMPFVTVLRAQAGQLADYTLNAAPFRAQMPYPVQETRSAEAIHEKLLEALQHPPPRTASPLIISGKKPQPAQAPAPKPEPTVVKVDAPAPVAVAPVTNNLLAAKPPVPAVPPVETARPEATTVTPAKPSTDGPPTPAPAPAPLTEPKLEAVKVPEPKPVEPAPAKPDVAPTVQPPAPKPQSVASEPPKPVPVPEPKPVLATASTPASEPAAQPKAETVKAIGTMSADAAPATPEAAHVFPPPGPKPGAAAIKPPQPPDALEPKPAPAPANPPPASIPRAPAQTGTAVPGETVARHTSIWIAGLVLAGAVAGFAVLLRRRSRTAPQASLITRSFERKHEP